MAYDDGLQRAISTSDLCRLFIGSLNPLILIVFILSLGFICLLYLLSKGWFTLYKKENLKKILPLLALAALLGLVMILVDMLVLFPEDINVLLPRSLLFYPVIGFVAEIIFHLLPLSMLLFILTTTVKNVKHEYLIWFCILIIALIEPVYQTIIMGFSRPYPLWLTAYIAIHIFFINLIELMIFKRYDFVSMYLFRLVYYLFWHIGWGYFRLILLF